MDLNIYNNIIANFSAGPAMLPVEVMQKAQEEFLNYNNTGMSIMEISHRSSVFLDLFDKLNNNLINILNIPSNYKILWTTGGATQQFSVIPLSYIVSFTDLNKNNNIIDLTQSVNYLITGYWSEKAYKSASKYQDYIKINKYNLTNYLADLNSKKLDLNNYIYNYFTPNETISGYYIDLIKYFDKLNLDINYNKLNLVADMSSCILSGPIDVSKYGMIFACSQKNFGPAGVTLVIIREDLLDKINNNLLPDICNYKKIAESNSMQNTPPTYNLYLINLILEWIKNKDGLNNIYKNNILKADKLYNYIDNSKLYRAYINPDDFNNYKDHRSIMNIVFNIVDQNSLNNSNNQNNKELENLFLQQAQEHNLFYLKGHRVLGGIRASIYNAMDMIRVDKLLDFMVEFEQNHI